MNNSTKEQVVVVGLGYVGAITAILIASVVDAAGEPTYHVVGLDQNNAIGNGKIKQLSGGTFPIECADPLVTIKLKECLKNGNLCFTTDLEIIRSSDIVLVALPLSLSADESSVEWQPFVDALLPIAARVVDDTLIVIVTTVPPGTTEHIIEPIFRKARQERGPHEKEHSKTVLIAHSYERVMPGEQYWKSASAMPRVFGGNCENSRRRCRQLLCRILGDRPELVTELARPRDSEVAKVLENGFRALNIAFIDEWSRFSESIGVNLFEVVAAIRQRDTHCNIMNPGFGVGGYCLTKDPIFAKIAAAEIFDLPDHSFPLATLSLHVNKQMPDTVIKRVEHLLGGSFKDRRLCLWGASYRQNVGDTRNSPSEVFYRTAVSRGASVDVVDPFVQQWSEVATVTPTINQAIRYDGLILAVSHSCFRNFDFKELNQPPAFIFDANNVLVDGQREQLDLLGIRHFTLGRGEAE